MKLSWKFWLLASILAWFVRDGARGQTLSIIGPASAQAGSTLNLSIVLGAGIVLPSAIQWTPSLPTGMTITPSIGTSAAAAAKSLNCNPILTKCLVFSGANATPIQPGEVAKLAVSIPSGTTGPKTFAVAAPIGSTPDGQPLLIAATAPLTVNIVAPPPLASVTVTSATVITAVAGSETCTFTKRNSDIRVVCSVSGTTKGTYTDSLGSGHEFQGARLFDANKITWDVQQLMPTRIYLYAITANEVSKSGSF